MDSNQTANNTDNNKLIKESAAESKNKETDYSDLINKPHGLQQNIKMELVDMLQQAMDPFDIIYALAQRIEADSAERGFAQHVLDNMRTIYGMALGNKKLMEDELKDVLSRCERIKTAQKKDGFIDDEKARMDFAIKAHERRAAKLQELIANKD